MDRFRWCSDEVEDYGCPSNSSDANIESIVVRQIGVRLYHGAERTCFDNGVLRLTTHRLLWSWNEFDQSSMGLPLAAVISAQNESFGFSIRSTPKLVLQLASYSTVQNFLFSVQNIYKWTDRWCAPDNETYRVLDCKTAEDSIKLGFTRAGHHSFERAFNEVLKAKLWTLSLHSDDKTSRSFGAGIGAIERQLAANAATTDLHISEAFYDLNQLISNAADAVQLIQNIATKMKNTKDGFTSNEIAELRSTMLAMGLSLSDETKLTATDSNSLSAASGDSFHTHLAYQLCGLIQPLIDENKNKSGMKRNSSFASAGCMDLASAYCHVNRARGMDLISPSDLLRACAELDIRSLPLRLKRYPGGLLVLQLATENEKQTLEATASIVEDATDGVSADEFAHLTNLSPLLARGRLLAVEEVGLICRDESQAGLRFYSNYFVKPPKLN